MHSAWQIAVSEVQRQALYADPKWNDGYFDPSDPPESGLALARQIAMISYRTSDGYDKKFGREIDEVTEKFQVRKYLEYQGMKFLSRFDAITYIKLTEQMDSHDLTRNRGPLKEVLGNLKSKILVMGMDSDVLYPVKDTIDMQALIPNSKFKLISTSEGHDGFLLEYDQVGCAISEFLEDIDEI